MSAGRRGALGVANSRGDSRPGGGVWKRERVILLCLAGCLWGPDRTKAAEGRRVEMGGREQQRHSLCLRVVRGTTGRRSRVGRAVPVIKVLFGRPFL